MDLDLSRLASELRAVASEGLVWSTGDPLERRRYQRVLRIADDLAALADVAGRAAEHMLDLAALERALERAPSAERA